MARFYAAAYRHSSQSALRAKSILIAKSLVALGTLTRVQELRAKRVSPRVCPQVHGEVGIGGVLLHVIFFFLITIYF